MQINERFTRGTIRWRLTSTDFPAHFENAQFARKIAMRLVDVTSFFAFSKSFLSSTKILTLSQVSLPSSRAFSQNLPMMAKLISMNF
jgi:hypothetical protein